MTARRAPLERLYVSDDELAEIGVSEEVLGVALRTLDRNPLSHFPKPDPMFGNKRYWPHIKEWFRIYNLQRNPQDRPQERKSA